MRELAFFIIIVNFNFSIMPYAANLNFSIMPYAAGEKSMPTTIEFEDAAAAGNLQIAPNASKLDVRFVIIVNFNFSIMPLCCRGGEPPYNH